MSAAHAVWGIASGLMVHGFEKRMQDAEDSQNSTRTPAVAAMDAAGL
jgi:hypothetical protein